MIADIYYALHRYYQSDTDTLVGMQELKEMLKTKYSGEFTDYYNEKAIDLGFCPDCLVPLETKCVTTNIHEYMGKPVDEKHIVLYCDCCSKEFD